MPSGDNSRHEGRISSDPMWIRVIKQPVCAERKRLRHSQQQLGQLGQQGARTGSHRGCVKRCLRSRTCSRGKANDRGSQQAHGGSKEVPAVGRVTVHPFQPRQRRGDGNPAVSGIQETRDAWVQGQQPRKQSETHRAGQQPQRRAFQVQPEIPRIAAENLRRSHGGEQEKWPLNGTRRMGWCAGIICWRIMCSGR